MFGLWMLRFRFYVGTMLRVFELNVKNPAFSQHKTNWNAKGFLWRTNVHPHLDIATRLWSLTGAPRNDIIGRDINRCTYFELIEYSQTLMKQLQTSVHYSFNCQSYNLATFRQQYASVRELPYFNKLMLLGISCVN